MHHLVDVKLYTMFSVCTSSEVYFQVVSSEKAASGDGVKAQDSRSKPTVAATTPAASLKITTSSQRQGSPTRTVAVADDEAAGAPAGVSGGGGVKPRGRGRGRGRNQVCPR